MNTRRPFYFGRYPPALHPNDPAYEDYYPEDDDDETDDTDEEE